MGAKTRFRTRLELYRKRQFAMLCRNAYTAQGTGDVE